MNSYSDNPRIILRSKDDIGDSPVWFTESKTLIWIDTVKQTINSFDLSNETHKTSQLSQPVFAIGKRTNGKIWGITQDSVCDINPLSGQVKVISAKAKLPEHSRLNNAGMDERGHIWAGCMDRAARPNKGNIYSFDTDGQAQTMACGFGICNGIAWSPDSTEMYYLDTLQRSLIAFEYNVAQGKIGSPRLVYDFLDMRGKPHGLSMDLEGHIWIAMWGGASVVKIDKSGVLHKVVQVPAKSVCACTLNETGDKLLMTTALFRTNDEDLKNYPENGSVLCVGV